MEQANVPCGVEAMEREIEAPLRRARQTGSRLYCGEFGVHLPAPPEVRKAWISDAVRTFESHGIGWALWDWKGVFGVVDRDGRSTGLEKALFGG